MHAIRSLTSVLERAYAPEADNTAWLEGIRGAAEAAFDGHLGGQVYTMRLHDESIETNAVVGEPCFVAGLRAAHDIADARVVAAYRAGGPVLRASRVMPPSDPHPAHALAAEIGMRDMVGAMGYASRSLACVVSFRLPSARARVSRQAHTALGRLAAHLAASYRLRARSRAGEAADGAVLSPRGALLDAGSSEEHAARERLREAALGITRARRESARDPAGGLAFWTAMVDGRWTLVERIDTDGKRHVLAKRNEPQTIARRALTSRERGVVERASLGGSIRHIAYELGLAESTVSATLARAMSRLGVQSRAELVELRSVIAPSGRGGQPGASASSAATRRPS